MVLGEASSTKYPWSCGLESLKWIGPLSSDSRNIIVHAYYKLSIPIVWSTATVDVSALQNYVDTIIASEFPTELLNFDPQ
ncbi:MAG: HepT-like ribonuclease domain-containing protein [Pyrinomonadaceae bacterium]